MSVGPEAAVWLREEVRAFYGTNKEATRIEGTVVAYSGTPMVLIEAEDGTRDWWDVELCEKTGGAERQRDHTALSVPVEADTNAAVREMRLLRLRVDATGGGPRGRVARFVLHQMETGKGLPV